MNEFRFASHNWIHLIWLVLAVAVLLIALELRGRSVLDQLVSRWMQARLVHRSSLLRRMAAVVLATISMMLLVFALMRPQWGVTMQQTLRVSSQIMVCLDVSKSMLAEDVAPNRLERAKVELDSLLGLMRDDQQVGLIAFAGKATVLCPLTTDFGFLRLVLNEAEPESVGLGGTKIGEAIQKAVDGFRESGDINRMILLITDGEDHDSFPLESAKSAQEKGVRIVCIGFGDEAGSKIEITDRRTGVRSFLKDREGQDVVSRLDGDTLRDIAMETDGAYVPAGTGALDLDSIYRAHIATLLKGTVDSQQRIVRNEAYQWFVIAATLFLILSIVSGAPWNLKTRAIVASQQLAFSSTGRAAALLVVLACLAAARPGGAQPPPPTAPEDQVSRDNQEREPQDTPPTSSMKRESPGATEADVASAQQAESMDTTLPTRAIYNQALAFVDSDPDRAEQYLNHARREAGSDGELRYRALYNLGWVEVNRADALLQSDPQQALQHLHQAANRFRESVRVRPDSEAARQNLEIISRRILELTDSLEKKDPRELAAQLDELIERMRAHQVELQALLQEVGSDQVNSGTDQYRNDYRRLAVSQRELISDTQLLSDDARAQQDAGEKKPDAEKTPADKVRVVQLGNMLGFLESGMQRMNRSRSLTRRLQGQEAFRRWSSALADMKRARDQLRDPVEVLGRIIADATQVAGYTQSLAADKASFSDNPPAVEVPAWLSVEYVQDLQNVTTHRTAELEQVFSSIAATQDVEAKTPVEDAQTQPTDPQTQMLLQNIKEAVPFVHRARGLFQQGVQELETGALDGAHGKQIDGIAALTSAWELFLDIRRLIELIYGQEQLVQRAIAGTAGAPERVPQLFAPLDDAQEKNLTRCQRLGALLKLERGQLPDSESPAATGPAPKSSAPDALPPNGEAQQEELAMRRQQLEVAEQLLAQVIADIQQSRTSLQAAVTASPSNGQTPQRATAPQDEGTTPSSDEAENPAQPPAVEKQPDQQTLSAPAQDEQNAPVGPLQEVSVAVDRALKNLEELRRLFFSLVEHLRDTAERQANLNDETTQLAADPAAAQQPAKSGPLGHRQQQLQTIAQQLAEALREQGEQAAAADQQAAASGGQSGNQPPSTAQMAQQLQQAAEFVDTAQQSMQTAAEQLRKVSSGKADQQQPLVATQEQQAAALQKLLEALALLDQRQQQNQQQNQQQQQEQEQGPTQDQNENQEKQQQQQMSANQLLQLIRDREAQRRKDKKQRAPVSGSVVDRDW